MEKSYYKAFVAQTPEEILLSVFKKEEDILVGISLDNGTYLEGVILDISKEDGHLKSVCILTQDEQVSYFNIHRMSVVIIKQPKKMVVELSKGAISRPMSSTDENLTVLQLKRWLQSAQSELGNQIQEFNIESISVDELNNRLNVKDVFTALSIAVHQITKDILGKEAWQGVYSIALKQGETVQLQITNKQLIITLAIHKALPVKLSEVFEEKLLQVL
ncbi:hypothetical protein [Maribacter sp. Asnod2-G09]|uniref:hypothetical protein n=1 Tax=Maribacter sp. Asnod2-G09 TaxID=3160577 RepID=UPI0038683805